MTDDTARAILRATPFTGDFNTPNTSLVCWYDGGGMSEEFDLSDLQAMAKLWLMRGEILTVMDDAGSSPHGCSQQFFDVEKRLKAFEE